MTPESPSDNDPLVTEPRSTHACHWQGSPLALAKAGARTNKVIKRVTIERGFANDLMRSLSTFDSPSIVLGGVRFGCPAEVLMCRFPSDVNVSLSSERWLERKDLGVMFTDPAFLAHRTRNSVVTPGRDLYHAAGHG
jgi:hypothetical protein